MLFKGGRHYAGHTCPYSRLGRHQALPTVVTKPRLESARIIHPTADHVLTVRAMARVQGFPDWYVLLSCLPHQREGCSGGAQGQAGPAEPVQAGWQQGGAAAGPGPGGGVAT